MTLLPPNKNPAKTTTLGRRLLKAHIRASGLLPLRGAHPHCLRRWQDRRQYYADQRTVRRLSARAERLERMRRIEARRNMLLELENAHGY